MALAQLKLNMLRNARYKKFTDMGYIGNPAIRIVPAGTFNAYRNWRVEISGINPSPVKIALATVDPEIRQWLVDTVAMDLETQYGSK